MKEPKRRQSLSGAVLVMVLTVMFVLIILLTATLTTVTTANQRIYTKFEENQAYYTARSALDVFTQNMLADKSYYAYTDSSGTRKYIYGDNKNAPMKQGLGLQLDLYSITSKGGMNITQADLFSYANTISVAADKKDEYKNYFGIKPGSGATPGTEINEIWYEIELPKTGDGSNKYGKISDYKTGTKTSVAKIKVEVLDRHYDMGNVPITISGVNTTVKDYIDSLDPNSETYQADLDAFMNNATYKNDIAKAIVTGNRKKDTMRVKITASATFDNIDGTAVLIYDSNEPPANNSSRAITAFGGTGSDNMSILGGMSAENTIKWGSNDGFIYGPVYVEEDFLMTSNGPKVYLNSGESFVVGGDVEIRNDHFVVDNTTNPAIVDDENAPFIYIGGELRTYGGLNGSPFKNMDVIVEEVNINGKIVFDNNCTIYCKKFTSNCGSNSAYNGDIYVDGDVTIYGDNDTKITYDGDGNPTVVHGGTGTIHFTGDIIDGNTGNLVTAGAGAGFAKELTGFWNNNIPDPSKVANPNPTASGSDDGSTIEFQLPGRTKKKKIETHVKNFDTYYVKDADGKRVMIATTDPVTGDPIQKPKVKSAQDMADINTMGDKTKQLTSANTGITDKLSEHYPSGSEYGIAFKRVIDTGGGDVNCIWDEAGANDTSIRIKGGGTVTLQLRNGNYNNGFILVDDDTTLKIVGDVDATGGGDDFAKLEVYNQTTYGAIKGVDVGKGTASLKVGNKAGVGIKVPKIFYYFTGSEFKVQTNCLLTGYIYAPDTKIDFPTASNSFFTGLQYNGNTITDTNTKVCVVGSALVKGATIPNNQGVAYINPDLDDDTPGEPIHSWQSFQYVRN